MTLKEAKKILEKEFAVIGLHKSAEPFEFNESAWIEHEKPSVLEAFRVLARGGYYIAISGHDYDMREKRLKEEYEENTKVLGSAEDHIKEDSCVNPALEEAASQFNDALLDEQGKKINHLTKKIARLNKIIHKKNEYLAELGLKYVVENEKLKKNLSEKDEVIAEKDKELASQKDLLDDISLKYDGAKHNLKLRMDECEKLKEKLYEASNRIKAIRDASKVYYEYGIAAEKVIQKMADVIVYDKPVFSEEEEKKFSPVKDTHPTEDNADEVKMNEILEHVLKVLDEGGTVYTIYAKSEEGVDQSATIVQHRKSLVDLFNEIKRLWQD